MLNIICYDLNGEPLRRFYQYDTGQKIVLKDIGTPSTLTVTLQCDTCIEPVAATTTVSDDDLIVNVNDDLLEVGLPLRGVIYRTVSGVMNIIGMFYIPVVRRPAPGYMWVDELPAAPTEDGTYQLPATVSDGVATYSWESV